MTENPNMIHSRSNDTARSLASFGDANSVSTYSPATDARDAFDGLDVTGYVFSAFSEQVR